MMKLLTLLSLALLAGMALLAQSPRGTVPLASAEKYSAHASQNGAAIGATLLSASHARKAFVSDVDACCKVVEVAIYPAKDGMVEVSLDDFALRVVGQDIASKPSSPELVSAKLQRRAEPRDIGGGPDVTIAPRAGIGYESGGIDPVSGQPRRGGLVTTTGVDVGIGKPAPEPPKAGSTDVDRRTMELELSEKGLPSGNTASPVAGFLYFSVPVRKKVKYQLEYNRNGSKVILPL